MITSPRMRYRNSGSDRPASSGENSMSSHLGAKVRVRVRVSVRGRVRVRVRVRVKDATVNVVVITGTVITSNLPEISALFFDTESVRVSAIVGWE